MQEVVYHMYIQFSLLLVSLYIWWQRMCFHKKIRARLLPKKILKGPSELNAENLGAQHMKWKVLLWKIKAPRAILWEPQATGLLLGNSLVGPILIARLRILYNLE